MALDTDIARLAHVPILAVLEPNALRLLTFSLETRLLRQNDVLFRENERALCAYFVLRGVVALRAESRLGLPPATAEAGVLIGETALIRETLRPGTAMAAEPATVLRISRALFTRVLREHPGTALRVQTFLADRLAAQLAAAID